jgi:hypothetical protein
VLFPYVIVQVNELDYQVDDDVTVANMAVNPRDKESDHAIDIQFISPKLFFLCSSLIFPLNNLWHRTGGVVWCLTTGSTIAGENLIKFLCNIKIDERSNPVHQVVIFTRKNVFRD